MTVDSELKPPSCFGCPPNTTSDDLGQVKWWNIYHRNGELWTPRKNSIDVFYFWKNVSDRPYKCVIHLFLDCFHVNGKLLGLPCSGFISIYPCTPDCSTTVTKLPKGRNRKKKKAKTSVAHWNLLEQGTEKFWCISCLEVIFLTLSDQILPKCNNIHIPYPGD